MSRVKLYTQVYYMYKLVKVYQHHFKKKYLYVFPYLFVVGFFFGGGGGQLNAHNVRRYLLITGD